MVYTPLGCTPSSPKVRARLLGLPRNTVWDAFACFFFVLLLVAVDRGKTTFLLVMSPTGRGTGYPSVSCLLIGVEISATARFAVGELGFCPEKEGRVPFGPGRNGAASKAGALQLNFRFWLYSG